MRVDASFLSWWILFSFTCVPLAAAANPDDFIDFTLRTETNALLLPGRMYVPPEASGASAPRPLIVFLHGAGESGTNNLAQINVNIDNLLAEAKERGAFLYAPQTNASWSPTTITNHVATMLDRAVAEYLVDDSRIYATGLSMGGGGVWNMLNRYPERFAAGVPIAAVSPAADFVPARLVDESIWAFHARNDTVVSMTATRNVINSFFNQAGDPLPAYPTSRDTVDPYHVDSETRDIHYTEPRTGGHGIWFGVYAYEPMYEWMFARGTVPEPNSIMLLAIGGTLMLRRRGRPAPAARH